MEAILAAMREGVIIIDDTRTVCYANPSASRLLAAPVDELVGKPTDLPVPASDATGDATEVSLPTGMVLELYICAISWRDRPARMITLRDITRHGQTEAAQRLRDETLAMSHDIARLQRIEAEVHDLNEKLHDMLAREQRARAEAESQRRLLGEIVDEAPSLMCVIEAQEQVFLYVNEIYCKVLGRTKAELMGKPVLEVQPELSVSGLDKIIEQVIHTGEPFRATEMLVPVDIYQDGRLHDRYFTFTYQPVRNAERQVTGMVVHAIDLTESVLARRAVEQKSQEIAAFNRELEQRVAKRTAELAAANRELEAFAYSVSHDLRAPLRRIDGFSRMLLEDWGHKLDDTGWHYLSRIRVGTQHMGELIDDLLTLAQVSRQELQTEEVDLSGLAQAAVNDLREQAPERNVTVHIEPAMSAWGDTRLLRVVLNNLLDNAWKFTSKRDDAVIEVGEAVSRDGAQVFYVRDNGAGFDSMFKDKLFGAFNRLHNPADFPGTGIGLATVKRVLDRHGGRIWAESTVNEGAVFSFALPAR